VRIAYLIESADNPTFLFPVVDAYAYDLLARKLASGLPPGNVLFWQPVLYPHFLAGMYALFGHGIWAAKIFQSAIGAATCMLTFWVGRFAISHRVGLVAGMIMALYGPVIFFETELLAAGLGLFWTVSLLLLFMLASRSGSSLLFLALGFCGVLATLTRPPLLVFFLTGCLVLAIRLKKQMNWHELAVRVLLVGVGFGTLASYVAFVNHTRTGHFGILPSSGGVNLYVGNNPRWQQTVTARPDRAWKEIVGLPNNQGIHDPWEQSQFQSEVVEYVHENPAAFIRGLLLKTVRFFNSREIPRNVDIYVFRKWSSILSVSTWKLGPYGFPFGLIWPLAVFGFVTSWRRVPYPLWVLVVTYPAVIILYFVSARYRILVVPCLAVMSAAGVLQLGSLILDGKWKQLLPSILLILGVSIASCLPAEFPEETASISYEAELYRYIGRARLEEGKYDEAIHHFDKALMINPDFADALNDTGAALLRQGKHDEAIPYLERAATREPSVALYPSNLGLAYLEKGNLSEAERHFRKAVELDPAYPFSQLNLGICLFRQKKFDEAIERFGQVLRQNPNHRRARLLLQNAVRSRRNNR
jgi:Flp pilus assembly protein TadD